MEQNTYNEKEKSHNKGKKHKADPSKPLNPNDLQGNKILTNLIDSSFAIGESYNDHSVRYIKQIKQRNTEELYGAGNVILCTVVKPANFLKFERLGPGREWEHLREKTREDDKKRLETILELKEQGMSLREIGQKMGLSHMKIAKMLKDLDENV